jgi:hypothetical protein
MASFISSDEPSSRGYSAASPDPSNNPEDQIGPTTEHIVIRDAEGPTNVETDRLIFDAKLRQLEAMLARALEFCILTAARSDEVNVGAFPAECMTAGRVHGCRPASATASTTFPIFCAGRWNRAAHVIGDKAEQA